MPDAAKKVSLTTVPDLVIHFAALFNTQANTGSMFLKVNRNVSNAKAKKLLGWTPIANNEEAILASMESIINYG